MKQTITWLLGLLFASILSYTVWSFFATPTFLMGETNVVTGKVIEVFPSQKVKTYNRRIKYVYTVNGKNYLDFKKLGTKDEKQEIGNHLQIVYSLKNPGRHKIKKHLNNFDNSWEDKYYSVTDKGYTELSLINGIFRLKEFKNGGKITNSYIGEYSSLNNDSLLFQYYNFDTPANENQKQKLFVIDSDGKHHQLIEAKTKDIFKKAF